MTIAFTGDGHGRPIEAAIFGATGCDTAEDAAAVARAAQSGGQSFDLDGITVKLGGAVQELNAIAADDLDAKALYMVPRGQMLVDISDQSDSATGGAYVSLQGTLEIPTVKGVAVVMSALPDFWNLVFTGRDLHDPQRGAPVSLSLTGKGAEKTLSLPLNSRKTSCQLASFQGAVSKSNTAETSATQYQYGRFVIFFHDSQPSATISVSTGLFSGLHFKLDSDKPHLSPVPLSYFQVNAISGEVKLGDRRLTLHDGDNLQIAGDGLTLADSTDGSFIVKGESRYVLLNGDLATRSLWSKMDAATRGLLLTTSIGAVGWIMRRHWDSIVEAARRLW